jgi:radical SAM superfamily enzyme with C-terminal helix-hairpin-helix motif
MNADAVIIDGYVDEPACFGVPPYISPYIRTVAGVLIEHGYSPEYSTIDQLRKDPLRFRDFSGAKIVVMISGVTVPGKYLGGTPATLTEIQQIGRQIRGPTTLIGGPIGFGYSPEGGKKAIKQAISGFDSLLTGSPAEALDSFIETGNPAGIPDYHRSDRWAVAGSSIIKIHPSYPHVMCELETARGCPRVAAGGCSFCTEPFYGQPEYRTVEGIVSEVAALYSHGARYFRLGRQPDLLAYGSGGGEFPEPRPDLLERLFSGIRSAAPDLKTLHIDNVNPGTIVRHEEKSREALKSIIRYHTAGDVAAFGMETADPDVVADNNLKAGPDEVLRAIEIVNEEGGKRRDGIPELLPGLNFIAGLAGETEATYDLNEQFLSNLLSRGLLVRRINIRQLMPFEGTPAYHENTLGKFESRFKQFKEFVRNRIDMPMLRLVFPQGTILAGVIIEQPGQISFGRQMGSYPILVGVPVMLEAGSVIDVVVVDWGSRSLTALPVPFRINALPPQAIKWIPGLGKTAKASLLAKRPFKNIDDFRAVCGPTAIDQFIEF